MLEDLQKQLKEIVSHYSKVYLIEISIGRHFHIRCHIEGERRVKTFESLIGLIEYLDSVH